MDLVQFDTKSAAEAGCVVNLDNPFTGEPMLDDDGSNFFIKILGGDSGKVSDALREIADRRLERVQKTRKLIADSASQHADDVNTLALATLEWKLPPIDGEVWACTEPNARKLYGDKRFPWIMEQLEKVISDRKRFFKKSSTA